MTGKKCGKCNQVKSLTEFREKKIGSGKYQSYCKVCEAAYLQDWRKVNKEHLQEYNRCYQKAHRDERNARQRQWSKANRGKENARQRRRRRANPERTRELARQESQRNAEAYRHRSREWKKNNLGLYRAQKARYNARRRAQMAGHDLPEAEKIIACKIYERDNGRCHLCGKLVSPEDFQMDHIIPLARGGQHISSNIAVACAFCNNSRGSRTMEEYQEWLRARLKGLIKSPKLDTDQTAAGAALETARRVGSSLF